MLDADAIGRNWRAARGRVDACAAGAAVTVTVVAVSKTMPAAAVRAAAAAGVTDVGENYLQEAEEKIAACADLPLVWHFVGHVQTRKAKRVATLFDWVHGVDRQTCAQKLSDGRAAAEGRGALNVFLQVNISGEESKAGFAANADELADAAAAVAALPHLRLRGFMALPAHTVDAGEQAAVFVRIAALQQEVAARAGLALDCLSMGMSGDFEAAIAAGATHVRLGTTIFGARTGK